MAMALAACSTYNPSDAVLATSASVPTKTDGRAAMQAEDAQARCASIAGLSLPSTVIDTAELITDGVFRTPGSDISMSLRGAAAAANDLIEDLPRLCRIAGTIGAETKFEVWLPLDNWNGRYHGVGIGGFAGSITYVGSHESLPGLSQAVRKGYAVSATDTGHQTDPEDRYGGLWAVGHPERLQNYFSDAIHETAVVSKRIVAAFYGEKPEYSTFAGCSGGGRQGLVEATKYPEDYDAIVAFAPTDIQLATAFIVGVSAAAHRDPAARLTPAQVDMTWDAIMKKCDGNDGLVDGSIGDPRRCDFRPAQLQCKPGQSGDCLTKAQVAGLEAYYRPLRDSSGNDRWDSPGETYFAGQSPGTGPYERLQSGAEPDVFTQGFWGRLFLQDPDWDWRDYNLKQVEQVVAKYGPLSSWTRNFDAFRERGGKLIFVQGWADWGITPETTITFYQEMLEKELGVEAGGKESSFMRLFMAPDTDHCKTGPLGLEFNALTAVDNWRSTGVAPERIVAARAKPLPDGSTRTRPICAFPKEAVHTGVGSTEDERNFQCKHIIPKGE